MMSRGRLRCRDRDLFLAAEGVQLVPADTSSNATNWNTEILRLVGHLIIELMASFVLMYSSVYVPEDGSDYMKQYVSSFSILAVMLTIKDQAYFCPDGTPMVTIVLAASGAYTDKDGKTDWVDIVVRLFGQVVGWAVVCFGIAGSNRSLFSYGVPEFKHITGGTDMTPVALGMWFTVLNEFPATFIECVAISFMVMPLLRCYSTGGVTEGFKSKGEAVQPSNKQLSVSAASLSTGGVTEGFKSKGEAVPPSNKQLLFSAASLAVLHYVLERVFRTCMNPLVFFMYSYAKNHYDGGMLAAVIGSQICALICACVYCRFLLPSQKVFEYLQRH
jgi:hypothetical protein